MEAGHLGRSRRGSVVRSPISLYFHIPFCTRKCPYCHFYVIPNHPDHRAALLEGLLLEWKRVRPYLENHQVVSIYFGGGTPSLFGHEPIATLLDTIERESSLAPQCEITLEANPEDIDLPFMQGYQRAGINRVSIGVQSLVDPSLQLLERTHSAKKALEAIGSTYEAGIENITIDLMYELPDQTVASFQETLDQIASLPISHLSLYNLTIEPHTPFSKRKLNLPSNEEGLLMLNAAKEHLEAIGLNRYEISAFAKPGYESVHNTGYWTARPFFGLGPSAFSYFEGSRFRNVAHLSRYLKALKGGKKAIDFSETLPYPKNILELLMVELRLLRGVEIGKFDLPETTHKTLKNLEDEGYLLREGQTLKLSEKGLLFYDTVASEFVL